MGWRGHCWPCVPWGSQAPDSAWGQKNLGILGEATGRVMLTGKKGVFVADCTPLPAQETPPGPPSPLQCGGESFDPFPYGRQRSRGT